MSKTISFAVVVLGFSSVIAQLVIVREFLNIFSGNELVVGIILANWLFLTALGSYFGRFFVKCNEGSIAKLQILIAVIPFAQLLLVRYLKNILGYGVLFGLPEIFFGSLIVLLPYCLLNGCVLSLASTVLKKKESAGQVYFLDSLGSVVGGLCFSFVLVLLMTPMQIALLILISNLIAAFILGLSSKKRSLLILSICVFVLVVIAFTTYNFESLSTQCQYQGQKILGYKNSLYGKLVVTENEGQLSFFENGVPLFSSNNTIANEEAVHYAMSQHPSPRNVLLISGAFSGIVDEITKYNVTIVDCVELDPEIIKLGNNFFALRNEKTNVIVGDARSHLRKVSSYYNVVIINLPDPTNAELNRFYTKEFFQEVKHGMKPNGIVTFGLTSSEDYMSPETKQLNAGLYLTLKSVFSNVLVFPATRNIFVASDSELSYSVAENLKEEKIETRYVNSFYLDSTLTKERIDYLNSSLKTKARLNQDFSPIAYYYYILFWTRQFSISITPFLIALLILIIIYLLQLKPVQFMIFTTGFASMAFEVIFVIAFQILYGYAYYGLAVIFAMFMLGLTTGSYWSNKFMKKWDRRELICSDIALLLFCVLVPVLFLILSRANSVSFPSFVVIPVLAAMLAFIAGIQFPIASKLLKNHHVFSALFSADLAGSAIGALAASVLLIPLLGIIKVCFLIAGLKLISLLIFRLSKNGL